MATAGVVTLQPNTTYHYRVLVAKRVQSEDGVNWQRRFVEGPDQTFTTLPPSTPPSEVLTGSAEPTPSGYKLTGKLNPDGLPTTYYYEYIGSNEVQCLDIEPGLDRCWHETAHAGPITGDTQQEVQPIEVTGLTAGVTYHYRLVATNADRTVFGNEASFTVGSPPVIESVSLSHLTSTDATLEAQIDTEGLGTTYHSTCGPHAAHEACEYLANIPLPSGSLLGSFVASERQPRPEQRRRDVAIRGEYGCGDRDHQRGRSHERERRSVRTAAPEHDRTAEHQRPPLSGSGQPAGSDNASSGDQPAGSGGSPASSVAAGRRTVLDTGLGKTPKLEPFENAQKLSKALKLCEKKPKNKRPSCKRQAEQQYSAAGKHRS